MFKESCIIYHNVKTIVVQHRCARLWHEHDRARQGSRLFGIRQSAGIEPQGRQATDNMYFYVKAGNKNSTSSKLLNIAWSGCSWTMLMSCNVRPTELVYSIIVDILSGHRFDNNTPIEETVCYPALGNFILLRFF